MVDKYAGERESKEFVASVNFIIIIIIIIIVWCFLGYLCFLLSTHINLKKGILVQNIYIINIYLQIKFC